MTTETFIKSIYACNGNDEKIIALFQDAILDNGETELVDYGREIELNLWSSDFNLSHPIFTLKVKR